MPAYETYQQRLKGYRSRADHLTRSGNRLSRLRLAAAIIIVIGLLVFFNMAHIGGMLVIVGFGLPVFGLLVFKHSRIGSELIHIQRMAEINRMAMARIDGQWREFTDNGAEFGMDHHPYAKDLDVFGPGSLFQWLNITGTFTGRNKLAGTLSSEHFDRSVAIARREAIVELAPLLDWRQELRAKSLQTDAFRKDPGPLMAWMKNGSSGPIHPVRYMWPMFTLLMPLAALLLYWTTGQLHLFTLWIPLNLVLLLLRRKPASDLLARFDDHEPALAIYGDLLRHIEQKTFQSDALRGCQRQLGSDTGVPASKAIAKLITLTAIGQVRYNHMLAVILNLLLLWDLQAALLLQRWQRKYGRHVESWLDVIGEVEMLSSMATLPFDNPDWCFPRIDDRNSFAAEEMGHPLLDKSRRVCNDITMGPTGSVLIITGSNMSGKTTLLRTIGVNLILAFSGAPVCAQTAQFSPVQLLTSMRITDDLQNGVSTFYAELLRIRSILDAVLDRPAIVLIDEIFHGTNTHDRHAAALHVLRLLAAGKANTVISTHDLDLANLEEMDPEKFRNFHFEDHYQDHAIHFDYRLRTGRSTASNALRLLEMVGILPAPVKPISSSE